MMNHQTRFGGGGRVVALLMVLLVGTVSWAGAASTATSALMTALMQDPTSPVDPAPPAQERIRTRSAPVVQENVDRAIAAAIGGTDGGGTDGGGTGDGGTGGGGGLQAGGEPVSVPVQQIFTGTTSGDAFRATSSDESVVTVTVTDNPRVVITPVGPGTATITVSASRPGRQAEISTRFDVTVGAPGVPALPLVATGVLGMFLFGAGLYRRWRRA